MYNTTKQGTNTYLMNTSGLFLKKKNQEKTMNSVDL